MEVDVRFDSELEDLEQVVRVIDWERESYLQSVEIDVRFDSELEDLEQEVKRVQEKKVIASLRKEGIVVSEREEMERFEGEEGEKAENVLSVANKVLIEAQIAEID